MNDDSRHSGPPATSLRSYGRSSHRVAGIARALLALAMVASLLGLRTIGGADLKDEIPSLQR